MHVEEDKLKLTLPKIKALNFDNIYLVNVIFYIRTHPNPLDANDIPTNNIRPAFYDKLNENDRGSPYWMTNISDGVRQYTINVPRDF